MHTGQSAPVHASHPPASVSSPPPRGTSLPLQYRGGAAQVITVDAPSYGSTTATVEAWNRTGSGWRPAVGPVRGFVGSDGVGQASESTSRTPAGTFGLPMAFGSQGDPGTALTYLTTGRTDWWDENPASPTYNEHVVRVGSPGGNSEDLYTATESGDGPAGFAYRYAIDIGYNTARVPGAGSAIFLHVSDGEPTAGCVSVPEWAMVAILRWVRPGAQIVIGAG